MIEGINVFEIMDLIGIKNDDKLYCLDSVQYARNEVMKVKQRERENK